MVVVIALGGNALLRRGQPMTEGQQRANVKIAAQALADIAREHTIVITHGNGPQVGLLALQSAAYTEVEPYPLDALGAQTEGMIGYLIEQELGNLLPYEQLRSWHALAQFFYSRQQQIYGLLVLYSYRNYITGSNAPQWVRIVLYSWSWLESAARIR